MLRKVAAAGCLLALIPATAAVASFPYEHGATPPNDLYDKTEWMYAASPEPGNTAVNADPRELNGVRGAHIVDADQTLPTAWKVTTGDPRVTIAILDSGIKWNSLSDMWDLREKTRINRGEAPAPLAGRTTATEPAFAYRPSAGATTLRTVPAPSCAAYAAAVAAGGTDGDRYDLNGDGVFNLLDYACDPRVDPDPPHGVGPHFNADFGPAADGKPMLDPQDVLIAFSQGEFHDDHDGNGFVDDLVGWDWLDNDNDPYDDVQYGHGTGEANDSSSQGDNAIWNDKASDPRCRQGCALPPCPDCTQIYMRVGDSFVADVNRFAQATLYAVDNDVSVVQEALGTLNNSLLATDAIDYAYDHGVTVIASAADEAAQHNNWPSSNPHVILVNSVTKYPGEEVEFPPGTKNPVPPPGAPGRSYLEFNGCTNFNAKITLAIPSVSCSSDATGRAAGMAGLIYAAALKAHEADDLDAHPTCERTDGDPCLLSANEVRQAMATGTLGGTEQADDVNFTGLDASAEPRCTPATPECTSPFESVGHLTDLRAPFPPRSYPARDGHDQFYGYGRVNVRKAVARTVEGTVFPEAEIASPDWYSFVNPDQPTLDIRGHVGTRSGTYKCHLYAAPGSYPNNGVGSDGDFVEFSSGQCNGADRTGSFDGLLGTIDLPTLKAKFPPDATAPPAQFKGRETGSTGNQSSNGRPNDDPYGFVVKVVVETGSGSALRTGEDRRNLRLHRDQDLLEGFPRDLGGDGASSPAFADLDGDNRNELIIAGSDGIVHAMRRDGSEIEGWPAKVDKLPLHTAERAFTVGEVSDDARAAILASVAVGDLDRDGVPEVVVADMEGHVTAFHADGTRAFTVESDPRFSGKPLEPFVNVRNGPPNRTQHGFIGSPVLADLDGDDGGRLEVVAAAMDRHVYAWDDDGEPVDGFPSLVVDTDPAKIQSIDPVTHAVTFKTGAFGYNDQGQPVVLMQGAIVDTPAVGDVEGDKKPEIVVGTNEEYLGNADGEGGYNVAPLNGFVLSFGSGVLLDKVNTRLHVLRATGDPDGNAANGAPEPPGWPLKLAQSRVETLPIVGEGVTGSPVLGSVACGGPTAGTVIGAQGHVGPSFVLKPDGSSCYGTAPDANGDDRPVPLQSDGKTGVDQEDTPVINAFGHPAFAKLESGPTTSYLTPAVGAVRALDVVLPEYQGGQDFLGAWNGETGQHRPGFPGRMNDLQFLTGPSVAEIDGTTPTQEILAASASLDLQGYNAAGAPIDQKWPKLTSDWTVANPLIGSWGDGDKKVVVEVTRSGFLLAYGVGAGVCSGPDAWPRFHHDNWNTGDGRRGDAQDTVAPGTPADVKLEGGELEFTGVGDDLMCGDGVTYELATSDEPIEDGHDFDAARRIEQPGASRAAARAAVSRELSGELGRFVAVRAVDDAGNVGRVVAVDRSAGGGAGNDGGGAGGDGSGGDARPIGGGTGTGTRPGGDGSRACSPIRRLRRATVRARGRRLAVTIPRGAGAVTVDVFQQSVGRRLGDRLVARFRSRRASFVWNGRANRRGRRVRDGILVLRMRAGDETKRFALRRAHGRFTLRPGYYRPALCRVLASAKLLRPVFGGRRGRALSLSFRLTREARVSITVLRGRRVVRRFAAKTYPGGRTFRRRVASRRRGDHRVRIVATAGARTDRVTLVARRL